MASIRDTLLGVFGFGESRKRVSPTRWAGAAGFSVYSGYLEADEVDKDLANHESRHRLYQSILANTSIVAASVRYYLNLVSRVDWKFEPADDSAEAQRYAELIEEMLMDDIRRPWHNIVRNMAMYRFYGFSVQEWIAARTDAGYLTFTDLRQRPQHTIERWDMDLDSGRPRGMVQRVPQDSSYLYLPRDKVVYVVDDALTDMPNGWGLFRHLAEPANRLKRFQQLEGFGFEVDLRNIPVGRVPLEQLAAAVKAGTINEKDAEEQIRPIKDFVQNHVRSPKLGLLLDSRMHETQDDAARPVSNTPLYSMELLSGSQTSLADSARAIERLNREMARIMGTEQLLLGSDSVGSYALAQDKTGQFYILCESSLAEIRQSVRLDLVERAFILNGWPLEMMPEPRTAAVRQSTVEEIAEALKSMATAGLVLMPGDPVENQVRDLLGVEHVPDELSMMRMMDAMSGGAEGDQGGGTGTAEGDDDLEGVQDE
ncbi:MAG: hypothetical protein OXE76_04000 [Alphaproteobacteria bacterium]|nr:hypothetical protein [Alphaproteobacteria bacterium]